MSLEFLFIALLIMVGFAVLIIMQKRLYEARKQSDIEDVVDRVFGMSAQKVAEQSKHILAGEKEAIKKGLIIRDTIRINVKDSLFGDKYIVDSIKYIPFSNGKIFTLGAGEVETGSKLKVKVFEAKAPSKYILQGLDMQQIINLNDGLAYKGLKVAGTPELQMRNFPELGIWHICLKTKQNEKTSKHSHKRFYVQQS